MIKQQRLLCVCPPSTVMFTPLMKLLASHARKRTASPISSAVPTRPTGISAAAILSVNSLTCSELIPCTVSYPSVGTALKLTTLTQILRIFSLGVQNLAMPCFIPLNGSLTRGCLVLYIICHHLVLLFPNSLRLGRDTTD
jgi:hypothetical protein